VIVCVVLKSFSQSHLSKMCTPIKIQLVNFFEIFGTGAAQICADLLEIRIDKKKNQMSMDVNQKYCQSCHLISRNGFIITKIMSSQICC
jgi:hypothetical protein